MIYSWGNQLLCIITLPILRIINPKDGWHGYEPVKQKHYTLFVNRQSDS